MSLIGARLSARGRTPLIVVGVLNDDYVCTSLDEFSSAAVVSREEMKAYKVEAAAESEHGHQQAGWNALSEQHAAAVANPGAIPPSPEDVFRKLAADAVDDD